MRSLTWDEICEAVAEARLETAGSRAWWRAVKAALSACAEHFGRQEEDVLADFARRAYRRLCQQLGSQWSAFTTARIHDLVPDSQVGDAACQLYQWPMPTGSRVCAHRGRSSSEQSACPRRWVVLVSGAISAMAISGSLSAAGGHRVRAWGLARHLTGSAFGRQHPALGVNMRSAAAARTKAVRRHGTERT